MPKVVRPRVHRRITKQPFLLDGPRARTDSVFYEYSLQSGSEVVSRMAEVYCVLYFADLVPADRMAQVAETWASVSKDLPQLSALVESMFVPLSQYRIPPGEQMSPHTDAELLKLNKEASALERELHNIGLP